MNLFINPENIQIIANKTGIINKKKKNRFDLILEPLQTILQLSFLAFSDKGTKISIDNNLLYLQSPNYTQGLIRWSQNDNKHDISVLFYACKRFPEYYKHLSNIKDSDTNLYDLLVDFAYKGLNKLSETYENSNDLSIHNNIKIYQLLLKSEIINTDNAINIDNSHNNIDNVFSKITNIYTSEDYKIIFNTMKKINSLQKNIDKLKCVDGLNKIMDVTTQNIHQWIINNLVF